MSKVFTIAEGLENMGALRTGGQGSVYKGRRIGPIISAVKIIPTPIHAESEDDKNFRNFKNEVEKLKKVNEDPNPNVVKILNSGITESGSFPFIEMEFIDGPDLEELLKPPHEPIFTIKETIKVADQLACALAHCHRVSVKHGDIKSNNVKFNSHTGNYILLDFGLAVMSEEQRRSSLRHAGAIEFMAPEQNDGVMLFQTDIYSYGVILYELLTGQVPFPLRDSGETARNLVMVAHMEKPVPDLLELRSQKLPQSWSENKKATEMQTPAWLLDIIRKCLEKLPENRFKNGIELHDAIVQGSVSAVKNEEVNASAGPVALQEENERLNALLTKYQEKERTGMVHISKPFFISLICLLVALTALTVGILINKNKVADNTPNQTPSIKTDSAQHTNTVSKPVQHKKTTIRPKDTTQTATSSTKKDTTVADSMSDVILQQQKKMLDRKNKAKKKGPLDISF